MTVWDEYQNVFDQAYLKKLYEERILLSSATGIDNLTHEKFFPVIDEQLNIVNRKVLVGSYSFTKYKLKLISKGRGKVPREISIPTIRDKIVLRSLCDFLQKRFSSALDFSLPQEVIKKIKSGLNDQSYNTFIKFDVSNFYPSIRHNKLLKTIGRRVKDERIISLIQSAITTPTVSRPSREDKLSGTGVPQGLSISNILAAIYLSNIDKHFKGKSNILYFRYVDDILILCNSDNYKDISKEVISKFNRLGLTVYSPIKNPEKSTIGTIGVNDFSYLGYSFKNGIVSARTSSIEKLRDSILSIFSGYKYSKVKSVKFLEWRLNLRITGCVFQNKFKGWVFFFSEINNETFLHEMDAFISSLCERYSVNLNVKSFVRTFFQVNNNRYETTYIPNFDNYTEEQMTNVLNNYFNKSTANMTSKQIKYNFLKRISRQVRDLETDIKDAGY